MATGPSTDRCRYGAQSRAVGEALPFGDLQRRLVVSTAQHRDPARLEQPAHDGGVAVESGCHQRG
eukprot:scaffold25201_cov51-Phaeocystis_antarctica.AAC.3